MAASPGWEGPPPGSPPTLSASKTVFFENIGTFCKTRPPKLNLSAAFPCSATHSRSDNPLLDRPEAVRHPFYQTKEIGAMTSPVVSNAKYVILGASGNTGSVVADFLLSKCGEVLVVVRDAA